MATNEYAQIIGDKEVVAELKKLAIDVTQSARIEEGLFRGALALRDQIREAAPLGKPHPVSRGAKVGANRMVGGGALRRGIVAKKYKFKQIGNPAVFVAIANKIAPHAWWVEHGARTVPAVAVPGLFRGNITGRRALKFFGSMGISRSGVHGASRSGSMGENFFAHATPGPMPAQPFFMVTVDRNRAQLEQLITMVACEAIRWSAIKLEYVNANGVMP